MRRHTVIAQKLEPVVAMSLMDFPVTDVPEPNSFMRAFEEHVLHHDKHIMIYATNEERYADWLNVVRIVGGSDDLTQGRRVALASVAVGVSPAGGFGAQRGVSPQRLRQQPAGDPHHCPIAGMTSPYSLAATLLQANIETIGLAALTQVVRRGHPYLYATGLSVGHMRQMHDMYYTLDKVLWKVGAVQLGKSYNIPVNAEAGGSMTYRYDHRTAPRARSSCSAGQFGRRPDHGDRLDVQRHRHVGRMMLIHTAWLAAAEYLKRGIQVDELRLGVESIRQPGRAAAS